jgi:oligopeptide transport system substrate-binding protein
MALCVACQTGITQGPKLAKEQSLRVQLDDQPSSLDPGQTQYPYETAVLRTISEPLLRPIPDLSGVVPAAADSYDVTNNGTVYVFHLHTAAKYWDGTPVKAQDFVYAWQRLIDPRLAAPNEVLFANAVLNGDRVSLLDPQRDASTLDAALGTLGLKALDEYTFQVTLSRSNPAFIWLAAMPAGAPMQRDAVTKTGDKWATSPETLLTNGPFRVTEIAKNDHIKVVRNPYYWGPKPTLTSISFVIVNDGAVALSRYRQGELDAISVQPSQALSVTSDATLKKQLVKTPDLTVYWLVFRVNSPPLDNVRIRQALAQAIDRDAFVAQVFQGQAMPSSTFIPKGMHGYASTLSTQRFDVAQARASLAASGLSAKQLSLTYSYDQSSDFGKATAQFVRDQLRANLGVEINLQALDANTLSSRLGSGQFQIAGPRGWSADYPDPADWYDIFLTTSSYNVAFYQNQQYDNFVRVAKTDTDPARRDQEYLQAQQMLTNDVPVVFLAQSVSWNLVQPYVRGVTTSPWGEWPGALVPGQISVAPH